MIRLDKSTYLVFIILLLLSIGYTQKDVELDFSQSNREVAPNIPKNTRQNAQKFEFQAEVTRLMDIIINSLYSNKDIFLRELISNAADALDKIRYLSLTNKSELATDSNLQIQISTVKEKNVIVLRDSGIGMTKDDLVKNLGTIAKSGTSAFIEQFKKSQDLKLIGQFGVGFYSVFLVADYVEVITKNNKDKQYIWESAADGNFMISEDTENEQIPRGTQINIYLKPESLSYLDQSTLRKLVYEYSEFIDFPINLYAEKEIEEEVQKDEAKSEEGEEDLLDEALKEEKQDKDVGEVEEEEEAEEDSKQKPVSEKVKKQVKEWEQLNKNKAIWVRDPKEVTEEQYNEFYKSITKEFASPLLYNHFKAEGDVEFKALLYIPAKPPNGYYDNYYNQPSSLRLYVRRVFITDQLDKLLPRYLRFVRGVLDSDSLPINVSREQLQQLGALRTIGKKLVRKILDSLRKLSQDAQGSEEEAEVEEDLEEVSEDRSSTTKLTKDEKIQVAKKKYDSFYVEYARSVKLGVIEDQTNRQKLTKLLRFFSTKSPEDHMSFDDYIGRMKKDQKSIYFLVGQSRSEVLSSPFLERLTRRGFEVIFMTDPMDEYMMTHISEYEDKQLINISKEDLKLDKDADEKKKDKQVREQFKPVLKWWKGLVGSSNLAISDVKISQRLSTTPAIVVSSKYGSTAYMEKIMRAQALKDSGNFIPTMQNQKILEINPDHPLMQTIMERALKAVGAGSDKEINNDKVDQKTKVMALLATDSAMLEGGFDLPDSKGLSERIRLVLKDYIGSKKDFEMQALPEPTEESIREEL